MEKDTLKWIVLYNSYFPNNHKDLFNKLKQYEQEGRLRLYRQCDYVCDEELDKMFLIAEDVSDLLTGKTREEFKDKSIKELKEAIIKNPKKTLKSVISLWYFKPIDDYTRIDIGEKDIEYMIDHEERYPKWKK